MILYLRVLKWCEDNDRLPEWQFGTEKSCLWLQLLEIALSTKFVKIFSYIYSKANVKILKGDEFSDIIKILKGVLQGQILSPLLFALFA